MTGLPDLEALGYTIDISPDGTVAAVRGFGVATTLDPADKTAVARLADPAAQAERRFQFLNPAASAARAQLLQAKYTVTRDDPSVDVFTVTPPEGSAAMTPTAQTPNGLEALAATLATGG